MADMISSASFHLCQPITKLFNSYLEYRASSFIMVRWSHMKGSRSDPGNYRGITLLSSFSKLFQTVFRNRLTQWADGILLDNQTGIKAGYSTMDNVFVLNTVVQKLEYNHHQPYTAALCFKWLFHRRYECFPKFVRPLLATILCVWEIWSGSNNQ